MLKGFLHLHHTVVVLFVLFLIYKTILLLTNKYEQLDRLREKTKIVEMIFGVLILLTGGFLLYKKASALGTVETYLILKIVLMLVGIPLGIVGLKKKSKPLAVLSVLIFTYIYLIGLGRDLNPFASAPERGEKIVDANQAAVLENGKAIFNSQCAVCHGEDGKKGSLGAKDLSQSTLSTEEKEAVITKGKGVMPPFGNKLSEAEVKALAIYVDSFRK